MSEVSLHTSEVAAMRISPQQVLSLLLTVAYFVVGITLTERAQRHLRNPNKHFWFTPMYEPHLFTDEGNRLRVRALRCWGLGGALLVLYFIFL
jgi:hypothetical protein